MRIIFIIISITEVVIVVSIIIIVTIELVIAIITLMIPLALQLGDFVEQLWDGESTVLIDLNNWGAEPQTLDKGQEIGLIEPVTLVECDDPIWNDTDENTSVRVCQIGGLGERKE